MTYKYRLEVIKRHVFTLDRLESFKDQVIFLIFLLRMIGVYWVGLYVTERGTLETLATLITATYSSLFFISGIVFIYNNFEDIFDVTECLMTTFLAIVVIAKMFILFINASKIRYLLDNLQMAHDSVRYAGGEYWIILSKRMKEARIVTRIIFYACLMVTFCFIVITIPRMKNFGMMIRAPLIGVPSDTVDGYTINFFWHFFGMIIVTSVMTGFDGLIVYIILTICGQIEILNAMLMKLGSDLNDTLIPDGEWLLDLRSTKKHLRDCLMLHQWILKVSGVMNSIYKFDCLQELICTTLVGCFSFFQIAENSDVPIQFYAYAIFCVVQIFAYCWYGDLIMDKSFEICNCIYLCSWYRLHVSEQRTLCIMLMKAQHPITLSAMFVDVDLMTFTTVMKSTYSYYTVLSTKKS